MLSYETVEPRTLELLKSLMQEPAFNDMRLVGGTALALQYGHRQSIDLDFFGDLTCEQEITQEIYQITTSESRRILFCFTSQSQQGIVFQLQR